MRGNRDVFTAREVEAMVAQLVKLGLHPSTIRRRLSEKGIHWEYQFIGQGQKERLKRLKRLGRGLCSACKADSYPLGSPVNVCETCLRKKWNPEPAAGAQQ